MIVPIGGGQGQAAVAGAPMPLPHLQAVDVTADGIELFNLNTVPVTRYRYRGNTIPSPWILNHA